jgi:hypothetical protein
MEMAMTKATIICVVTQGTTEKVQQKTACKARSLNGGGFLPKHKGKRE